MNNNKLLQHIETKTQQAIADPGKAKRISAGYYVVATTDGMVWDIVHNTPAEGYDCDRWTTGGLGTLADDEHMSKRDAMQAIAEWEAEFGKVNSPFSKGRQICPR